MAQGKAMEQGTRMPAPGHFKLLLSRRLLAEALVRESQNLIVVAVRTRRKGGCPDTIRPLLAEWRAPNEPK